MSLRAVAGGLGHTWGTGLADGEPVPGFAVSVGAFAADWSCGDPACSAATSERWPAADGRLYVDLAPLAPQGASPERGSVSLDYVELGVPYWRTGCAEPSELDPGGTPDGTPCTDGDPDTAGETCRSHRCVAP